MELVDQGIMIRAKYLGTALENISSDYDAGMTYGLKVTKDPSGPVLVELATGKGKRSYKTLNEYLKDWEELEIEKPTEKRVYNLSVSFNEDGTPKLDHTNDGMPIPEIVMSLEIAKLQLIQSATRQEG